MPARPEERQGAMHTGDSGAARPERTDAAPNQHNGGRSASAPKPCLSFVDKQRLESLLEMGGGYVLDFSNRTLAEFVLDVTGHDIYDSKYDYESGSKANRIRAFWTHESPQLVGRLIHGLLDYYQLTNPTGGNAQLVAECERIASRLLGEPVPVGADEQRTRQPIDAEFQFEAGAVTLASGEVFSPTKHAVERWGLVLRSGFEAAGNGVELLYQTADDQFILVKAHIGPPDFYSENIQRAAIVGHDEARAWMQRYNFMLPDCLMKGVKTFPSVSQEASKASDPSPVPAPDGTPHAVNIGNWAEGGKAFAEALKAAHPFSPTIGADATSNADGPSPDRGGAVSKLDGWTRAELIDQANHDDGEAAKTLSGTTFDRIRDAAGIPSAEKGGMGAQRRFSVAQLRQLIGAAEAGTYRNGFNIASAWRELLPS